MLAEPLDIKEGGKKSLVVTNTEFADKLEKYLKEYKAPEEYSRIQGRRNFTIACFYGARLTITLVEYTNPKQVQFYFNRRSAATGLKIVLGRDANRFWKTMERALEFMRDSSRDYFGVRT